MAPQARKSRIEIQLTPEQESQVRQVEYLEESTAALYAEVLEERTSPRCITKPIDKATPL